MGGRKGRVLVSSLPGIVFLFCFLPREETLHEALTEDEDGAPCEFARAARAEPQPGGSQNTQVFPHSSRG